MKSKLPFVWCVKDITVDNNGIPRIRHYMTGSITQAFAGICGEASKKIADITTTTYTVDKLKANTYYKFKVKAYKVVNGNKVIIARSQQVHSITTSATYAYAQNGVSKKITVTVK